jgi:Cu(I)/Ag(I) efflux system membrane fusion protein
MKQSTGVGFGVVAVAIIAAGGGYWLGHRGSAPTAPGASAAMTGASAPAGDTGKQEKKLLYYRNPMGLPDTSPVPKKDPMGMDYIAVYAGGDESEPAAPGQIRISTEKVQKLGVRTEAARSRTLDRTVRAAGRVEPDERRVYAIAPKFEGYVERLLVNVTGQPVSKGQPLFEVYSPELVSAQREYAIAMQGVASLKDAGGTAQTGMQQLAESSLQRLRSWDISDEQIKALASSGEAKRTLTFRSTASGIVTEKKAVQGMRFMPGEALYQVADLSSVWVIADVFEQDIGLIKSGSTAKIRINAYPDKLFEGKVTYVYPTLKAETRTVPVRVELANPGLLLKPAMFAQVELSVPAKDSVVTVPVSAVIDSGTRQIVLVQKGEGRFEPREVKLGGAQRHLCGSHRRCEGRRAGGGGGQLPDRRRKQSEGSDRRLQQHRAAAPAKAEMPSATGPAHTQGRRPPGRRHRRQRGREGGNDQPQSRPGGQPEVAGHDHGVQGGQSVPASALKPGAKVSFEFIERQPGEWVITSVKPMGKHVEHETAPARAKPYWRRSSAGH